ncbi:hypothetical protein N9S00_07055 [Luminiphilus sp.]|nr:hypothetical protein [Luminiphilus sp.]
MSFTRADRAIINDMSPAVRADFEFGNNLFSAAAQIIGPHLIKPAPMQLDCANGTDFVVLHADGVNIAYRARKHHQLKPQYRNEFTIRTERRPANNPSVRLPTELGKAIAGKVQLSFYGFANADNTGFDCWHLIDLRELTAEIARPNTYARKLATDPGLWISNPDGLTKFAAFDIRKLPADVVIASTETTNEERNHVTH